MKKNSTNENIFIKKFKKGEKICAKEWKIFPSSHNAVQLKGLTF